MSIPQQVQRPAKHISANTQAPQQPAPKPHKNTWLGAVIVALVLHIAVWWMPVSLPAMQLEPPRTVRLTLLKAPPPRRPKIQPPKRRAVQPPPKRRVRRKRRKFRRNRRVRRKRKRLRKPPRKIAKPQPIPRQKPRRIAARPTQRPQPAMPAARIPTQPHVPAPPVQSQRGRHKVDMRGYGMGVYRAIQRHKRYPLMAYRMRFEGMVILSIRIAKTGRLMGRPLVVKSSGHSILDREAVRMVLAAAPLRPMPRGYARPYATFRVPVNFHIRN